MSILQWSLFSFFFFLLHSDLTQRAEKWLQVILWVLTVWTQHLLPLRLMGAELLHHCCWDHWLAHQYTPASFPLVLLSVGLFNSSLNGGGHTPPGGIDLAWMTFPAPSAAPLCGPYRGRHDAILRAPPAVPSHYEGTLASQCDPPVPRTPNMTSLHTCPTQLHKECAAPARQRHGGGVSSVRNAPIQGYRWVKRMRSSFLKQGVRSTVDANTVPSSYCLWLMINCLLSLSQWTDSGPMSLWWVLFVIALLYRAMRHYSQVYFHTVMVKWVWVGLKITHDRNSSILNTDDNCVFPTIARRHIVIWANLHMCFNTQQQCEARQVC